MHDTDKVFYQVHHLNKAMNVKVVEQSLYGEDQQKLLQTLQLKVTQKA